MPAAGNHSPAIFRRAFFVYSLLWAAPLLAAAPANSLPPLSQTGKPDAAEAARILEQFRNSGIPGGYYLEFELRDLPRRGDERVYHGRLWGARNDLGAINRVELTDATGQTYRFLLQNGERAAVWRQAGGRVAPLDANALFEAVIPGVEVTAFDLQRPFLFWPDATLVNISRILGRPAYTFLFRAPANVVTGTAGVSAVRAYFDTQFNQPLQTELLDGAGKVLKTFSVVSLKTVDHQTLPKAVDFRNEFTRDKTRFQVTAAALNLALPKAIFDPGRLNEKAAVPSPENLTRIEP